jgi:hypothetical protein
VQQAAEGYDDHGFPPIRKHDENFSLRGRALNISVCERLRLVTNGGLVFGEFVALITECSLFTRMNDEKLGRVSGLCGPGVTSGGC